MTEQRIQNKIQRKFLTIEYIPYEEIEWGNKDKYATKCTSTFNSPFIPALNWILAFFLLSVSWSTFLFSVSWSTYVEFLKKPLH